MVNQEHIDREVEKTLGSLDGISRAHANPYLFTRIKARMQPNSIWEQFVARPVVAFAALVLVILINAFVLFNSGSNTTTEQEGIAINDIADEYNLASTSNYDY